MTELKDITSTRDLQSLPFAGLFYEIFDSPNRKDAAEKIANMLMPGFSDAMTPNDSMEWLSAIREELEDRREQRMWEEEAVKESILSIDEDARERILRGSYRTFFIIYSHTPAADGSSFKERTKSFSEAEKTRTCQSSTMPE